jgi:hypothetical protein
VAVATTDGSSTALGISTAAGDRGARGGGSLPARSSKNGCSRGESRPWRGGAVP